MNSSWTRKRAVHACSPGVAVARLAAAAAAAAGTALQLVLVQQQLPLL